MTKEALVVDQLHEYAGFLNLSRMPEIRHAMTPQDKEVLVCDADIPYPEGGNGPLREIVLPQRVATNADGSTFSGSVFDLPSDYLTFGSVLNESFSVMSERSEDFLRGVLREIGTSLKRIKDAGQGVPTSLSYRQIIIQRDIPAFNLLPPLEMVRGTREKSDLEELGLVMLKECQDVAVTSSRSAKLVDLFQDFFITVEGE